MKKIILLSTVLIASILVFAFYKSSASKKPSLSNGVGQWAAFGQYKTGDSVLYLWGNGKWKNGAIMEVGVPYNAALKNAASYELKYKVAEYTGWPDWKDFSQVVLPLREAWWTNFFNGEWNLGEVMAVNTRTNGNYEHTEFSYHKATETLKVLSNGTYVWKTSDKTINGKWIPLTEGPGIVLQKAYKAMDWTFINQSNAITMHIRKLENGRLFPSGTETSKAATRPMK